MPIKVFKARTAQLADLFGVTTKTVYEWAHTWLGPAKVGKDSFIGRQAVALWLEKIAAPKTPEGQESEGDARRRYEIARADKEELRVKREAESLVSKDEAIGWLVQILSEAKTAFLGAGRRLAPEAYGKEPRDIEGIIDDEMKRILRKLARPVEEMNLEQRNEDHQSENGPEKVGGRRGVSGVRPGKSSTSPETTGKPDRQPVGRKKSDAGGADKRRAGAVAKRKNPISRRDHGRPQRPAR